MRLLILVFGIALLSCKNKLAIQSGLIDGKANEALIDTGGNTIESRIKCPPGFNRSVADTNSFTQYLRTLPLKPFNSDVLLYHGKSKGVHVHCGVIDLAIRNKDLQQCADSGMRLYAEYLYQQKQYDNISFNFTNGQACAYRKYAEGNRMRFNNNKAVWVPSAGVDYSYTTFQDYLDLVYMYAGSFSLSEELKLKPILEISPGDLFINPGFPGHVVIVMDVCVNAAGEKLFLLGQGFTPAQEVEILINLEEDDINPWYTIPNATLNTPQYNFTVDQLYSWK